MSDIGSISGGGRYQNFLPDAVGTQTTGTTGLNAVDSSQLLGELQRLAATLQAQNPGGTSGVTNSNGAPSIDGVQINFSPEDMMAALQVLQGKTQEAQLKTAKEGLQTSKTKMDQSNQRAMDKINEWIKKCEEASAKAKAAGPFGWIVKIATFLAAALAVVAAAVATAATGGAAAPLLALAVIGMVGATISLASQISQAAGGPALELSSLLSKALGKMFEAMGIPKEKAEAAGNLVSGFLGMASGVGLVLDPGFAGQFAGGIAALAGADPAQTAIVSAVFSAVAAIAVSVVMIVASGGTNVGAAVDGISKTIMTAARIGQAATSIAAGAASVTQGGLNMAKAVDERDAANIQADKKMIDALIAKLQKSMEEDREEIKKVMQQMQDGIQIVNQMIAGAAQSRSQLSANLGARNTV